MSCSFCVLLTSTNVRSGYSTPSPAFDVPSSTAQSFRLSPLNPVVPLSVLFKPSLEFPHSRALDEQRALYLQPQLVPQLFRQHQ